MKKEISFIIPAFNEEAMLPRTLKSIENALEGVKVEAEIVVVDNNSTDRTAEVAKAAKVDKTVFEPVNNIATARNAGAKASEGDAFLFVDADTLISKELLEEALASLRSGKICGGGARLEFDEEIPGILGLTVKLWNGLSPLFKVAAGSFIFCTREAFDGAGGFDPSLYAAEDVSMSLRLRLWGRKKGLRFVILKSPGVSSARRVKMTSKLKLLSTFCLIALMPWRLRSKKGCAMWYDHKTRNPGKQRENQD